MHELKVRKIGNSFGLVLPKEVLARMHVAEGSPVYITEAPDGSYRLTPYDPEFAEQMEAAEEGLAAYRNALRELAK
jgi:putative addiction module antidote